MYMYNVNVMVWYMVRYGILCLVLHGCNAMQCHVLQCNVLSNVLEWDGIEWNVCVYVCMHTFLCATKYW